MIQAFLDKIKAYLQPKPVRVAGARLYAVCVDQARQPAFYLDYGVEDAIGARFELLTFHVGLVIERLKSPGSGDARHARALELSQALFDSFLEALDNTLREQGTGDLTVPKKMKTLGKIIYTRMRRWDDLWREDAAARADYAARTIFAGGAFDHDDESGEGETRGEARPEAFAAYAEAARAALDIDAVMAGRLQWIAVPELAANEMKESA